MTSRIKIQCFYIMFSFKNYFNIFINKFKWHNTYFCCFCFCFCEIATKICYVAWNICRLVTYKWYTVDIPICFDNSNHLELLKCLWETCEQFLCKSLKKKILKEKKNTIFSFELTKVTFSYHNGFLKRNISRTKTFLFSTLCVYCY